MYKRKFNGDSHHASENSWIPNYVNNGDQTMSTIEETKVIHANVIIIGSGPSGIAAATKLIKSGFQNVKILEAEDRIGGRIHTIPFAANVIDMGAQWCHGEKDNIVYSMAAKYDTLEHSVKKIDKEMCIQSDGNRPSEELIERIQKIIEGILEDSETKFVGYEKSVGDFLNEKFGEILNNQENQDIDNAVAYQYLEFYHKGRTSADGCDTLFELSTSGATEYWECEGDQLLNWKDNGYITILNILMETYPDENHQNLLQGKIILSKKVDQINWNPSNDSTNVLLKCADGSEYKADHVICTVSLGVLKENHTSLFTPPLPTITQRSIEGLGFGTVNKVFLEFSEPFWEDDWPGVCFLWRSEDLQEIRQRENNWITDVIGIFTVDHQPNILCSWLVGVKSREMEQSSEKEVLDGHLFLLEKFLKREIPKPINCKRTTWHSNPNFRGSYSFRSLRTDELEASAANLAVPLKKIDSDVPIVLFAGEATSDHYYSTVHGASETGWREADRLFQLYK